MIAWLVWCVLVLHLFLLEGWLGSHLPGVPDMAVGISLFLVVHARPERIPALLLGAALSRSVLLEGGAALHVLSMGVPAAVLLPVRGLFFRRRLLWQTGAASLLLLAVPRVARWLGGLMERDVAAVPAAGWEFACAVVVLPLVAATLAALPPMSGFREGSE